MLDGLNPGCIWVLVCYNLYYVISSIYQHAIAHVFVLMLDMDIEHIYVYMEKASKPSWPCAVYSAFSIRISKRDIAFKLLRLTYNNKYPPKHDWHDNASNGMAFHLEISNGFPLSLKFYMIESRCGFFLFISFSFDFILLLTTYHDKSCFSHLNAKRK